MLEWFMNNILWLQQCAIAHVSFQECVAHVGEALKVQWNEQYSAIYGKNTEGKFTSAQNTYDNIHLPVMDLVIEALKHDDFLDHLKLIFKPPTTTGVEEEGDQKGDEDAPDV
ncbi:hypothetical protein Hanom_Chr04g00328341 [Helianthus anomalus]